MWYLILYGVFAAWVLFDGLSRKDGGAAVGWALGTVLLGPLVLPVYLAKRPLKNGEIREGGTAWNVLKNFAIVWTIVMAVATFSALSTMGQYATTLQSDAERAGAGIGMFLGMGLFAVVWFVPTLGAALLGFLMKKNSVVETGPTGPLIGTNSNAGVVNGLAGLVLAAVISVIVISALAHRGESTSTISSVSPLAKPNGIASVPASPQKWAYRTNEDSMGRKRSFATVESTNTLSLGFPYQEVQHGTLTIRKSAQWGTNVLVSVERGQFLCRIGKCVVNVRFDDGAIQQFSAVEPDDNSTTTLFINNEARFVSQLRKAKIVRVEATFYQQGSRTLEFNVEGFKWE